MCHGRLWCKVSSTTTEITATDSPPAHSPAGTAPCRAASATRPEARPPCCRRAKGQEPEHAGEHAPTGHNGQHPPGRTGALERQSGP